MSVAVGNTVEGVVTGITNFGAFVELPGGSTGLIHISEIADTYVKDVKEYLKEQQRVKVKVIKVGDDGKIALSMKQLNGTSGARKQRDGKRPQRRKRGQASFEDKLAKFMKESDEKQQHLQNKNDARSGTKSTRASGGGGK